MEAVLASVLRAAKRLPRERRVVGPGRSSSCSRTSDRVGCLTKVRPRERYEDESLSRLTSEASVSSTAGVVERTAERGGDAYVRPRDLTVGVGCSESSSIRSEESGREKPWPRLMVWYCLLASVEPCSSELPVVERNRKGGLYVLGVIGDVAGLGVEDGLSEKNSSSSTSAESGSSG